MPLAFSASQELTLPVEDHLDRLPAYLADEERVIGALFNPQQLVPLAPGRYRYTVTQVRVFQLKIQPVVELQLDHPGQGCLEINALDCDLEGLGLVDDFDLSLGARLAVDQEGLQGDATLAVTVSQPPLLKFVAPKVLEATGRSVLNGILLGIRTRVSRKLVEDFHRWCGETSEN